jgi:hypothetical protein
MVAATYTTFHSLSLLLVLLGNWLNPAIAPLDYERLANTDSRAGLSGLDRDTQYQAFLSSLPAGRSDQLVGAYAPGVFALPIIQQPAGSPAYVANLADVATQFSMAADYGVIGLLAHNTLAGERFFDLELDDQVVLVHGDGQNQAYLVTEIRRLQALQPYSHYSEFIDLDAPGGRLTAADLFSQIYNMPGRLVLQTCIAANGVDSWGRLFVIAEPVEIIALSSFAEPADYYWVQHN